jgi:hypothetical protein
LSISQGSFEVKLTNYESASDAITRKKGGTGLELAISKRSTHAAQVKSGFFWFFGTPGGSHST